MEYKKFKADITTQTRDLREFEKDTGNIYETIVILSKRANQIALEMKEELNNKLSEFSSSSDNLEEVFENREQIEIAKYYEHLPKPSLLSIAEFSNNQTFYKNPVNESSE